MIVPLWRAIEGDGFIELAGSTFQHLISVGTSGLTQIGFPSVAATVAVNYLPFESFDEQQMAVVITAAINDDSTLEGVSAIDKTDSVFVSGADSVTGILISLVSGIEDRAGNPLYPNRDGGDTTFEINLTSGLDWGDAGVLNWDVAEPVHYPVTMAEDGARHQVVDGFHLGSSVDVEPDGSHSENYDGDDQDELASGAGIAQSFIEEELTDLQPGKIYSLVVNVNGVGPDRQGFIDAWIDYNHDGSWKPFTGAHPITGEDVEVIEKLKFHSTVDAVDPVTLQPTEISGEVVIENGPNVLYFEVPPQATKYCPALRIRLSSTGGLLPTGLAENGEVEDYRLFAHAGDWHNKAIPQDVNIDSFVSPIDALLVINYLNNNLSGGDGKLPGRSAAEAGTAPLIDVNDDGFVSSIDALQVINYINSTEAEGEAEGDAEGDAEEALMIHYGVTQASVTAASIADLVEPVASSVAVDIPVMASPERVREAQFAELDLGRESSLDAVLEDIGGEVSDLRDIEDGHDEFFASVQY
jgi:hypothetical protein